MIVEVSAYYWVISKHFTNNTKVHWTWLFIAQLIFLGMHAATTIFEFHQRFSMGFISGNCDGHFRIFWDFFWNQALINSM